MNVHDSQSADVVADSIPADWRAEFELPWSSGMVAANGVA
jgi:hypothetical protein